MPLIKRLTPAQKIRAAVQGLEAVLRPLETALSRAHTLPEATCASGRGGGGGGSRAGDPRLTAILCAVKATVLPEVAGHFPALSAQFAALFALFPPSDFYRCAGFTSLACLPAYWGCGCWFCGCGDWRWCWDWCWCWCWCWSWWYCCTR